MRAQNDNKRRRKVAENKRTKLPKTLGEYLVFFPRIIFAIFLTAIIFISPLLFIAGSKSFYVNNQNEECYEMISEKDCNDLLMSAFNYLNKNEPLDSRYSPREQSHFEDVKVILNFAKQLVFVLLIFLGIYFTIMNINNKSEIFKTLRLAGIISISFMLLLLIGIIFSFSSTFFLFHALLFPQGNWTFPFDFTILIIFPEQFFVHAAFVSFLLSLGIGLAILGFSHLHKKIILKNKTIKKN
jgi:integral membrane protein (TIGR01906 family)